MAFRAGDRVKVKNLGAGTIIKVDGGKALVKLDTGLQMLQPFDKMEAYQNGNGNAAAPSVVAPTPASAPTKEVAEKFRSLLEEKHDEQVKESAPKKRDAIQNPKVLNDIESLRYGVVPFANIEKLTIGFDRMQDWAQGRLPDKAGRPTVSEVCGAFGTGKSHSMSLVRHIASNRGYLTARVEIDSQEVTLANPEGLLKALWPTLSGADLESAHPIVEICLRALLHNEKPPRLNAPIERTEQNYKTVGILANRDTIDEVIEEFDGLMSSSQQYTAADLKRQIKQQKLAGVMEFDVHPPIGRTTSQKPNDFLETLIAYAMLAEKAGFRGLVITIDEFEITRQSDPAKLHRCADLLAIFTKYFHGHLSYPKAPLAVFFATVADGDAIGDRLIETIIGDDDSAQFALTQLGRAEIMDLAKRIFQLYAEGYAIEEQFDPNLAERIIDHVEAGSSGGLSIIREFIKTWIYTLDGHYGPSAA